MKMNKISSSQRMGTREPVVARGRRVKAREATIRAIRTRSTKEEQGMDPRTRGAARVKAEARAKTETRLSPRAVSAFFQMAAEFAMVSMATTVAPNAMLAWSVLMAGTFVASLDAARNIACSPALRND
jgi:hypothetical protein